MFDKAKYLTRGVDAEIPVFVQLAIWQMIEQARAKIKLDYLQVFNLTAVKTESTQIIKHSQEQSKYAYTVGFDFDNPVSAKIYVIDSVDYATMLLASEY